MADDTLVNLHKKCDLHRGRLLDTSPHLTENVLLAMKVMTDKSADKIFAGKLKMKKRPRNFENTRIFSYVRHKSDAK